MSLIKVRASTLDVTGINASSGGSVGINVMTIPGVVNDGSADITSTLQTYIDALLNNNTLYTLYFPAGLYNIVGLKLAGTLGNKQVSLVGENRDNTQIIRPSTDTTYAYIAALSRLSIISGIYFNYNTLLKDNAPINSGANILYLSATSKNTIKNNTFSDSKYAGISVGADQGNPLNTTYLTIKDNLFYSCVTSIIAKNISLNCAITNNTFIGSTGADVILTGAVDTDVCSNLSLSSAVGALGSTASINLAGSCINVNVCYNKITSNNASGIISIGNDKINIASNTITVSSIVGFGVGVINANTNVSITNNTITNAKSPIVVQNNNTTVNISDNIVLNGQQFGIYVSQGSGSSNTNVSITNNTINKTQLAGINVTDGNSGLLVSNNTVIDPNMSATVATANASGIYLAAANGFVCCNNLISGGNTVGHGTPTYGIYAVGSIFSASTLMGNVCNISTVTNYFQAYCVTTGNV